MRAVSVWILPLMTCQRWLVVCLVWPVRSWLPHLSSVLWSGFIRQGGKVARKLEVWTNVQRLNSCFDTFFWCDFCQTMENVVWQTFKSQVIFTPEILPDNIHGSVSGIWCFWRSAVFVLLQRCVLSPSGGVLNSDWVCLGSCLIFLFFF